MEGGAICERKQVFLALSYFGAGRIEGDGIEYDDHSTDVLEIV